MAEANPTFTIKSLNIRPPMNNFQTVVATTHPGGDISSGTIGTINDPGANIPIPQGSPSGITTPPAILNVITAYPSNCFALYWDFQVVGGETEYSVSLYSFMHGATACFWKKKEASAPSVNFDLKIDGHGSIDLTVLP